MYCPNPQCQSSTERPHLLISERSGIEIDYCPQCRGVWLDRGELDKLIERAQQDIASERSPEPARAPRPQERPYDNQQHSDRKLDDRRYDDRRHEDRKYEDRKHYERGYDHYGKPRKKSLLSEIFDF